MRARIFTTALAVAALMFSAAPAWAHITANPNVGPQEGRATTYFRVGHGCESDGPNTVEIAIQIPEGVIGAVPEDEPGWTSETKMRKLDEPIEAEGEELTEVPGEITFTSIEPAGLDEHKFREFGLSLNIAAPGEEVLYFPVVQKCQQGANRWVNIPPSLEEWGDTENPAAYLELTPAEEAETEEAPAMTEDDVRAIAASEASAVEPESDTDPMVWVALVLGALGLLLGAGAFMRSGRKA
ncbi:MAG: YcnI family protein [Actinomycetota bacterium]